MGELNLAYAMVVLEHGNGTRNGEPGRRCRIQPVLHDDRQWRPNVQQLHHGGSFCTDNAKVQAPWRREDNMPPSSANMREPVPRTSGPHIVHEILPIEVENV